MDDFLKAIHDAVIDAGAKDLARKMGCSHVALLQRANPNSPDHRMNVEQLFQVLVHSGDMRPLVALAAAVVPMRRIMQIQPAAVLKGE